MIYFMSDAHLGSKAIDDPTAHQTRVVELLQRMSKDATAIYLLGDMFDFWYEYLWRDSSKAQYTPFLNCLRELTDKGIEVHFFTGNHDIWTFGWLAEQTGMIVHKEPLDITLHGKRCFLAHGDGLTKTDRKFLFIRGLFHNPLAQQLFRLVPPGLGNQIGYSWAASSRRKHLQVPNQYLGENVEEQMVFAKQHEETDHFDYYIFGHRHLEMSLLLKTGAQVCCIGDFCDHSQYARMDAEGRFYFEEYAE